MDPRAAMSAGTAGLTGRPSFWYILERMRWLLEMGDLLDRATTPRSS